MFRVIRLIKTVDPVSIIQHSTAKSSFGALKAIFWFLDTITLDSRRPPHPNPSPPVFGKTWGEGLSEPSPAAVHLRCGRGQGQIRFVRSRQGELHWRSSSPL